MLRSRPVDGFELAYEREGAGPAVVLLHGWPGDHADYRAVMPLLSNSADVVVPDDPEDQQTPIDGEYDKPDRLDDQLDWLREAGFEATPVWVHKDLAVVRAWTTTD